VRFLVVITIHVKEDGLELDPLNLRMMEEFSEMFPNCREAVSIVVNRLEMKATNDMPARVRKCIYDTIANTEELRKHIRRPDALRKYFELALGQLHIVVRPPYKLSKTQETDWKEPFNDARRAVMAICNNEQARFIATKELVSKLDIFKEGDNAGNQQF
jgi:hypothetical protein